jgi:hypothetical protein
MSPSSSEDEERNTTGACLEESSCSNTSERGQCEETSSGDPSGGDDPKGFDGEVGASLGAGLPSLLGERARLVPLLSSIVHEQKARKVNPKRERKQEMRYGYPVKHRIGIIMDVVLVPARPLECTISRTVDHAPVIQMVKKVV